LRRIDKFIVKVEIYFSCHSLSCTDTHFNIFIFNDVRVLTVFRIHFDCFNVDVHFEVIDIVIFTNIRMRDYLSVLLELDARDFSTFTTFREFHFSEINNMVSILNDKE